MGYGRETFFEVAARHEESQMKKFTARVRLLSLAVVAIATLFAATETFAQGGGGDRTRLQTRMRAGRMQATAKFEERGSRMKFNFQLELGTPGDQVTVIANGSVSNLVLGTPVVNSLGRAIIDIDNTEGDNVTRLVAGDVISVQINGATVMSGTLQAR